MKTIATVILGIALLSTTTSAPAGAVRGYFRSNGTYVAPYYRTPANSLPYDNLNYRGYSDSRGGSGSAILPCHPMPTPDLAPSIGMTRGYFRTDGTYVSPYLRTTPNGNSYDNLGNLWR